MRRSDVISRTDFAAAWLSRRVFLEITVEKLSRIWQHCDALGVSLTLDGAKDEGATRRPGRKTESGFAAEVERGGTGMR